MTIVRSISQRLKASPVVAGLTDRRGSQDNYNGPQMLATRAPDGSRNSMYPTGPTVVKGSAAFGIFFWGTHEGAEFVIHTDGTKNFGIGNPDNLTFRVFNDVVDNDTVSLDATVGLPFTGMYAVNPPKYHTEESHSGDACIAVAEDTLGSRYIGRNLNGATELFVSFVMKVPAGKYYPSGATEVEDFGENSAHFKPMWIANIPWNDADFNNRFNGTHADIAAFVKVINHFTYGTNDVGMPVITDFVPASIWRWNTWMRFSIWIKAGTDPDVDPGTVWMQVIAEGVGQESDTRNPIVFGGGTAPHQMEWAQLPGITDNVVTGSQCLYDRPYLNAHAGSAARVEIGDSPVYEECTNLQLMPITDWDEDFIPGEYYEGTLGSLTGKYLHVTKYDNSQLETLAL